MRIAFLVTSFPTISETFILDQITGLIDIGCEVEIFAALPATRSAVHPEVDSYGLLRLCHPSPMPESFLRRPFDASRLALARRREMGRPHARSLNIFRYGNRAASLRFFFETVATTGVRPFDVIHCQFGPNGLRGLALREIGALSGKLVTSFQGYDVWEFPKQRRRNPYLQLFARGDLFLAPSQQIREKLVELGCNANRILVHHLGVKPKLFSNLHRGQGGMPVRILSVGRFVAKKGFEYALQSVAALIQEEPHVEYTIIGDGPLKQQIVTMVEKLGLSRIVQLVGWQPRPEVVHALASADILLAPSVTAESGDQEGTPVVIMEALASGKPVVSTTHSGISEVVQDGVSGYLAPERDVPKLTAALLRLIRNPELRTAMGAKGRATIEAQHDIEKLNHNLLGIYRAIPTPVAAG